MKTISIMLVASVLGVLGLTGTTHGAGQYATVEYPPLTAENELQVGVTYTLWIPEGVKTLRGVIVHQHGAGTTASKEGATAAYDLHWQALAKKWDCALLGPSYHVLNEKNDITPGGSELWFDPRRGSEKAFLKALDDLATKSGHPELKAVPWVLWGHSGGGIWSDVMATLHPDRVVAVWMRSGTALMFLTHAEFTRPKVPDALAAIPMMCNPGVKEKPTGPEKPDAEDKRTVEEKMKGPWLGSLATFKEYRAKGVPIGLAPDPRTGHECGDSRYLAIPFLDACLAMRLPDKGAKDQTLKPLDLSKAWLAPLLGEKAEPVASYKGNPKEAVWLPNEAVAKAWMEYVKTGAVGDTTPPPAPINVRVSSKGDKGAEITWDAEADFESGIRAFIVLRDGQELAQVPPKPVGKFGRPLFQSMTYHDTPSKPLPEMRYVDASAKPGDEYTYTVITVNSVELKSEPSAKATPQKEPPAQLPSKEETSQPRDYQFDKTVLCLVRPASGKPFEWQAVSPESEGLSKEKLDALKDELATRKTHAFLVIRNDKIVYEWYATGHGPDKKHGAASLSKATVTGLALALLLTDGKLKLDTPVADLVAAWKDDPSKRKITLRHLGSHTSGLADAEQDGLRHDQLTGWKGDFWKQLDPPHDPFTVARDKAPVLFEPGAKLQYSNPGIAMLCYAMTAALKGEPQKDIRSLLRARVIQPIGVADEEWSVGYGKTYKVDGLPLVAGWGGGSYTARAMARVGRLLLREGDWDGNQILSKETVRQITGDAGLPGHCGMGFWTNADGRYPKLPKDTYYGAGAGDQLLIVVPSLNLIVVRYGEALAPGPKDAKDVFEAFHDQRVKILFEPLLAAITDAPKKSGAAPYPPSKVIKNIAWAPKETIVRKAHDSDNWPLTWADDGHQYTAYGDGYGFEPFVPKKLGLGFARVEGGPTDFKGVNVRSPSGEQSGNGAKSKKASGILCVEGVLYLWTRNAGNAQLARSKDHGKTWEWADWKWTTSFGCPTFLNFGKDYAGARDEWVYVYSPDAESAYQSADRMVLARVPKGKITERSAYEFFKGLDEKQRPLWSKEVADRGAVFTHKGRCYRSGITFNAGLKRYLWVQIIPGTEGKKADTRFEGGFAIYDAPEPWGPWTTVYFTEKWDVGPGDTASFPTKWMSDDGKTLYLVFSGDDNFAIRKANLTVASAEKSPPK